MRELRHSWCWREGRYTVSNVGSQDSLNNTGERRTESIERSIKASRFRGRTKTKAKGLTTNTASTTDTKITQWTEKLILKNLKTIRQVLINRAAPSRTLNSFVILYLYLKTFKRQKCFS